MLSHMLPVGGELRNMAKTEQLTEEMPTQREVNGKVVDKIKSMRAQGYTVREIMGALKVSPKTVLKYAPSTELVKVEDRTIPSIFQIPEALLEAAARHGMTPVFEETTRRIYFKKLE